MITKHYYHCATKGLKDGILFPGLNSFVAGMNRIGICLIQSIRGNYPIRILAFCLMDNHVHFILYGTEDDCYRFMTNYRKLTEMWFAFHPEEGQGKKKWDIGVWKISDQESLIEKIVYVFRNPTVAGLAVSPQGYLWSSAGLMFVDKTFLQKEYTPVSTISLSKKRRMFNTKTLIPDNWLVNESGLIWPGCYVEYDRAERLFKSAAAFNYEMNKKVEEKVNSEMLTDQISLPDNEMKGKAEALSAELFQSKIKELNVSQRQNLARILKKETGASTKQLARIVGIRMETLKVLI